MKLCYQLVLMLDGRVVLHPQNKESADSPLAWRILNAVAFRYLGSLATKRLLYEIAGEMRSCFRERIEEDPRIDDIEIVLMHERREPGAVVLVPL
jgi:hypothetical protein